VTLDGVSLTVNTVKDTPMALPNAGNEPFPSGLRRDASAMLTPPMTTSFSVNIIPHTTKVTSFGRLKVGDDVNIEIDMLARYVARLTGAK
jgi:riboflavin synthase alpha subunit